MTQRSCRYEDCGRDLTGYPPASKYCSIEHAALAKRDQEADYARRNRSLINLRRRNREAKRAREQNGYQPPAPPEKTLPDGRSRPPLIDGVLRGKGKEYAGSHDPDVVDELPWMVSRADDRRVTFHATRAEPRSYDALGRTSRERPVREEVQSGQMVNPAAGGMLYAPSSAVGRALLQAQRQGSRFGLTSSPPCSSRAGCWPAPRRRWSIPRILCASRSARPATS